jgi:hypothetical protein
MRRPGVDSQAFLREYVPVPPGSCGQCGIHQLRRALSSWVKEDGDNRARLGRKGQVAGGSLNACNEDGLMSLLVVRIWNCTTRSRQERTRQENRAR